MSTIRRLARKALRAALAWTGRPAPADPQTEHAAWMARVRAIADEQRTARMTGCEDGFCAHGIDRADLGRFRDEIELIAWVMQRERERGQ